MHYDSDDPDEQDAIDELCGRLTEVCQDYDSNTIFVALATMLTIVCAEAGRIEGLNEFIEVFGERVRSIWLEKQSMSGKLQ